MAIGRPRKFSKDIINDIISFGKITTERGARNHINMFLAFGVVKDSDIENLEFLCSRTRGTLNIGVLVELGKINDSDMILNIARHICEKAKKEKHTVRKWAAYVRYCQLLLKNQWNEYQRGEYLIQNNLQEFLISETVS